MSEVTPPKTLNLSARRKEAIRVYFDNKKLSDRLFNKDSTVNIRSHYKNYKETRKHVDIASRLPLIEKRAKL